LVFVSLQVGRRALAQHRTHLEQRVRATGIGCRRLHGDEIADHSEDLSFSRLGHYLVGLFESR
jgi:hypothetical protein